MNDHDSLFLHEEIMLLLLRDREGTIEFGANYQYALGGAILAELLLASRLRTETDGKKKLAHVNSDEPMGDELLDECLEKVATSKKPRTIEDWVGRFANVKALKHRVAQELCRRGILRADEDKVLLIFTRKIYPEIDHAPEEAIIDRLDDAIFTDTDDITARTAVLLSLARGADVLKFAFDKKLLKERNDRIEHIVNGEISGAATKDAIEAMQAALMVAIVVPVIATTAVHT